MKEIQILKDFCTDQGELQYLCKEFNCDEYESVYTQEQALIKADEDEAFKALMQIMNQEIIEIDA